ncbi:MAG: isoprenylcysteine carboxylmethyltransferase family protein [Nitrospirae bacterium]|nr:isoprenylcysteine carboxylmethyltransferase family protein [Nitrospirota bacterium]
MSSIKYLFLDNRMLLSKFFMAGVGAMVLFSGSCWEENGFIGGILFMLGTVLAGIAAVGRMWCSVYISGYKRKSLVTTGPYSMCRNPLYLFSLLGAVGVGLVTKTLSIPLTIFILFAVYYPLVIRREESDLVERHGEAFREYRRRVPAFIPSFSLLEEPEEYSIIPGSLRRRFIDSLWFMWLVGLIALIEELHRHNIIPVYFRLY